MPSPEDVLLNHIRQVHIYHDCSRKANVHMSLTSDLYAVLMLL